MACFRLQKTRRGPNADLSVRSVLSHVSAFLRGCCVTKHYLICARRDLMIPLFNNQFNTDASTWSARCRLPRSPWHAGLRQCRKIRYRFHSRLPRIQPENFRGSKNSVSKINLVYRICHKRQSDDRVYTCSDRRTFVFMETLCFETKARGLIFLPSLWELVKGRLLTNGLSCIDALRDCRSLDHIACLVNVVRPARRLQLVGIPFATGFKRLWMDKFDTGCLARLANLPLLL